MPRPLYVLKNIVEQDPLITREKINNLLGGITVISDKAHKYLAECIKLLTTLNITSGVALDTTSRAYVHIIDLGVRAWNDIKITSELTKKGLYLQAMMTIRDAIETMAIVEYLHSFPEQAESWWKAKTRKERVRLGLNGIKDHIEDGQEWKDIWDSLSSFIHPNAQAVPVYGADQPYYGHNIYLSGFYSPSSVEFLFTLQLDLCITFLRRLKDWYKAELEFSEEFLQEIDSLEVEYHTQVGYFKKRMESEEKEVVDKVVATRLSDDELIEWFESFENSSQAYFTQYIDFLPIGRMKTFYPMILYPLNQVFLQKQPLRVYLEKSY